MDASLFKDRDIFQKCLENIQKEVSRSKEDFLQEHFPSMMSRLCLLLDLDEMYCRPSQSLCPSWQNLEQTFSVEAPTAQASSFSVDRYTVIASHQTLCPTLLLGIFGTKHPPEKRFQGKSHRIALRQVPNDYKSYGLPCKLARRTTVESIAP